MTIVRLVWGGPLVLVEGLHNPVAVAAYIAARDEFWERTAAAARQRAMPKPPPPTPVVLIPTQRQRASGVTLVDATAEQQPAACKRLTALARERGFTVRVTYAHAYMPPKRGGEDWWENHSVVLRVGRAADHVQAWGAWSNGKWDAGQIARPGVLTGIGAREFAALLGTSPEFAVAGAGSLDNRQSVNIGSTT